MTGPLHWHVHNTGAVQVYRNGKLLMDEELTRDQLVSLASDLLLAAGSGRVGQQRPPDVGQTERMTI